MHETLKNPRLDVFPLSKLFNADLLRAYKSLNKSQSEEKLAAKMMHDFDGTFSHKII